jgi:type 1 glutamine amidotransferase/mannose-6-phosphate isomerase-like protein (cupin superfamily)
MRLLMLLLGTLLLGGAMSPPTPILIFSHTSGFRHASIEPAVAALGAAARARGYAVTASEDPALFDDAARLRGFKAIVLVSTTTKRDDPASEWLVGARRDALQAFVRAGGGIVGVHAAANGHYGWDWYGRMMGAWFVRHPKGMLAGTITRAQLDHPAIRDLPASFAHTDEWYWFDDLNPQLRPLLMFDPKSIGEKGANPRPLAWAHHFEGGRVFYSALGHDAGHWSDPRLIGHVMGGLDWATGRGARAMVVIDEAAKQVDEPPPHGRIGMSTAWRITDGVPGRMMEYRKRALHRGAAIGVHPIDHDEVYAVVSGEGEVTSDGVTVTLKPGMTAYLYTGAQVGIRQTGKAPLVLIISDPLEKVPQK